MVLTWLLTIAAVVLIFIELGGWSAEDNPHAILGMITAVVCFLQPIGALFRPAPTSSKRPIFNWLHWLGGNVAHICASKCSMEMKLLLTFSMTFAVFFIKFINMTIFLFFFYVHLQLSQYSLLLN